jgi:haloalkane dehalogenase
MQYLDAGPPAGPVARSSPGTGVGGSASAWSGRTRISRTWTKPFVTSFSDQDSISASFAEPFRLEVPEAEGQPHHTITEARHCLQEDRGMELAHRLLEFIRAFNNHRPRPAR